MKLTIVMPVHNEEDVIEAVITQFHAQLRDHFDSFEILAVENGSTDGTPTALARLSKKFKNFRHIHIDDANFGEALRQGYLHSKGDIIATSFVDWISIPFLTKTIPMMDRYDIIAGTKTIGNYDQRPWTRKTISRMYNGLLRLFFGLQVTDTHAMSVFRRKKIIPIVKKTVMDWSIFPSELILRSQHAGLRITQHPVAVKEKRTAKKGITRRVFRAAGGLIKLRFIFWKESLRRKPKY